MIIFHTFRTELPSKKKKERTKQKIREEGGVRKKGKEGGREGGRESGRGGERVKRWEGEDFRVLWSDLPPFKPSPMKTFPC